MIKLAALREVVKAACPVLRADPDKLLVFADEGKVVAHGTGSLGFEYQYTGHLVITDMSGDADALFVAVLAWAQVNQPELLAVNDPTQSITFEADIVNHEAYDLSIKLKLSEAVRVTAGVGGVQQIHHVAEEVPEWRRTGLV